jgi:hypothetical protein
MGLCCDFLAAFDIGKALGWFKPARLNQEAMAGSGHRVLQMPDRSTGRASPVFDDFKPGFHRITSGYTALFEERNRAKDARLSHNYIRRPFS